jgi:hypothetical protein
MNNAYCKYRPATEGDYGLVVSSWVSSYRPQIKWLPKPFYDRIYREAVAKALEKYAVIVACDPSNEDTIMGWCCGDKHQSILHYVFVKSLFRRLGVASGLLDDCFADNRVTITHHTPEIDYFANRIEEIRNDLFLKIESES